MVDYGNSRQDFWNFWKEIHSINEGIELRVVSVKAEYFHMAHARNVGIRAAKGEIVVAFLADQILYSGFFQYIREVMQLGAFLKWEETFAFHRDDILEAGGFDERFEFYGPEGKELTDRLQRNGLELIDIPNNLVSQLRTSNEEKLKNYRLPLSKMDMHLQGMAIWKENQERGVLTANEGRGWGCA